MMQHCCNIAAALLQHCCGIAAALLQHCVRWQFNLYCILLIIASKRSYWPQRHTSYSYMGHTSLRLCSLRQPASSNQFHIKSMGFHLCYSCLAMPWSIPAHSGIHGIHVRFGQNIQGMPQKWITQQWPLTMTSAVRHGYRYLQQRPLGYAATLGHQAAIPLNSLQSTEKCQRSHRSWPKCTSQDIAKMRLGYFPSHLQKKIKKNEGQWLITYTWKTLILFAGELWLIYSSL